MKKLIKELMKKPKFRKASREVDSDAYWQASKAVFVGRGRAGLTQKQLARKIGTKQSGIARIENTGRVSLANLSRIAKALNKKIIIEFKSHAQ